VLVGVEELDLILSGGKEALLVHDVVMVVDRYYIVGACRG
jgi:hypothetical protein